MRKILVLFMILVAAGTQAQRPTKPWSQGIGLRVGVPLGITYKKYIGRFHAAEFNVGSASPFWSRYYYQNSFNEYGEYTTSRYVSHNVESTLYLEGRYVVHFNIPVEGMEGNLNWYWGIGGAIKLAKVKYNYDDAESIPRRQTDVKTDVDIGPEGIIGMEYHLEDLPFTVFGEGSVMLEVFDRLGSVRTFGALGARYNFR